MNEYIKNLIKAGFKVYLLDIDSEQKEEEIVKNAAVLGRSKKINWRTINKIKNLKEEGWSSQETAEDLKLPLETVNKYWA